MRGARCETRGAATLAFEGRACCATARGTRPTHYLVLSEWAKHAQLAEVMRGLGWLDRDQLVAWAAEPTRVYDEIVESVGDTTERE